MQEAVYFARDFIGRFFPGADFIKGIFDAISESDDPASSYLPTIAYTAGMFEMQQENYKGAERFFSAAVVANCIEDAPKSQAYCEYYKESAAAMLGILK